MLNDEPGLGAIEEERGARTRAGAGALVGGVLGVLFGAVVGWLLGSSVGPVPVIGPVVGQGALASTLAGMLAGLGIGALVGALAGVLQVVPEGEEVEAHPQQPPVRPLPLAPAVEPPVYRGQSVGVPARTESWTALPTVEHKDEGMEGEDWPGATGGGSIVGMESDRDTDPNLEQVEPDGHGEVEYGGDSGPNRASSELERAAVTEPAGITTSMEATEMADEQHGRNPNTFTGTEDAINPDTGALGTAGTPLTTGYGVSGSTIGTGSARGQAEQENENFRGPTPGTKSYDRGGQGSPDADKLQGDERGPSAVQKHSDADTGRVEADIPSDPTQRDIYESTPGYGENLARGANTDRTDLYSDAGVDSPPSYANAGMDRSQASPGTDIPGTSNIVGLGDNTDDPDSAPQ